MPASTTSAQPPPGPDTAERLLIFARVPQPGQAKTRLIPALGQEQASRLHHALTLKTLAAAAELVSRRPVGVEAWFAGGDEPARRQLLGSYPFSSHVQQGDDLGERLRRAVSAAFAGGGQRVVVIGTDCPDINAKTLATAFDALQRHDVVWGPAQDGGYYLVGLRRDQPELFQGIDWGTEHVLRQSLAVCRSMGLKVHQLAALPDVDRAEDLVVCRRIGQELAEVLPTVVPGRISIIMPTLNEAANIERTLQAIAGQGDIEVIVADGGSSDETAETAVRCGAIVVRANRGRGRQLNAGAALASGQVLLFLHADTLLPAGFAQQVWQTLQQGAVAGAFRLHIDSDRAGFRLIEWGANLRSRYLHMPYGDQGLFMRSDTFYELGGFPNWPLMEDYELCRRLLRRGRISLVAEPVRTSARRWLRRGIWRTTLLNQLCVAGYRLGVCPERLAKWYAGRGGRKQD
ncbi:MAG: TIGR04283 family arsenosugar biosynthesis glycosyltransferase [Pirellulales bacterium]